MVKITRKSLKNRLKEFRTARKTKDELDKEIKTAQPTLIGLLKEFDPNNQGVVYTTSDPDGKTAAFVQQNKAQEVWNVEAINDFLNMPENKKLRTACTSRSLSIAKFEAEVAEGNIPASVAKKLKTMGEKPAPFIRFAKPEENSK